MSEANLSRLKQSRYTIYYSERPEYTGPPEQAPERDVQAIEQDDPKVGWTILTKRDFYVWAEWGQWIGLDSNGLWDYLARPGWKRVLFGRTISHAEYQVIYDKVKARRGERMHKQYPGEMKVNDA
jgi:hypothetical protein